MKHLNSGDFNNYNRWTTEDSDYIKENFKKYTNKEIGAVLKRSPDSVRKQLEKLGCHRRKSKVVVNPVTRGRKKKGRTIWHIYELICRKRRDEIRDKKAKRDEVLKQQKEKDWANSQLKETEIPKTEKEMFHTEVLFNGTITEISASSPEKLRKLANKLLLSSD